MVCRICDGHDTVHFDGVFEEGSGFSLEDVLVWDSGLMRDSADTGQVESGMDFLSHDLNILLDIGLSLKRRGRAENMAYQKKGHYQDCHIRSHNDYSQFVYCV